MYSRWALVLGGLIDIIFGVALLMAPAATLSFLFLLFGIYAVLQGTALVAAALAGDNSKSYRSWLAIGGALSFFTGIIALFYREAAFIIVIYFIAFRAIFVGISELITSIRLRNVIHNEFLLGLAGVLNILFGLFILFYPVASVTVLLLVLGWYSVIVGIVLVIRGFMARPAAAY